MVHRAAADGFERGAGDYELARPGYPAALVARLVEVLPLSARSQVLDLAAGTGKLTRDLLDTGADVVAVEPVEAMRRQLRAMCPEARVLEGTAEDIPLADSSVDAATVAQAFHWFDARRALDELHRVLRPGGGLAVIWNLRDEAVGWIADFTEILVRHGGGRPYGAGGQAHGDAPAGTGTWLQTFEAHPGFGPVTMEEFPNSVTSSPALLEARASSTSFVSALPAAEREACLAEVRALVAEHPDLAGKDTFDFPHVTRLYWTRVAG